MKQMVVAVFDNEPAALEALRELTRPVQRRRRVALCVGRNRERKGGEGQRQANRR
jgi:hypothetical protein